MTHEAPFFKAGGTLGLKDRCYVTRPADDELYRRVLAGEFCYVLTPRQMGKSSLMVRSADRLKREDPLNQRGLRGVVTIDLTEIGLAPLDQWYVSVLGRIQRQLRLTVKAETWWTEKAAFAPTDRFTSYLREVVLTECQTQVVIFIDEIDTTLQFEFRDDFFAAIRAMYNARATESAFERLTFVLLGVASPSDLIRDRSRTPFNIGHAISLEEFSRADAKPLEDELERLYPEHGAAILDRIFHWTSGYPYLTLKLAQEVALHGGEVDELVRRLFLDVEIGQDNNLKYIQDRILGDPSVNRILQIYKRILKEQKILDEEKSTPKNRLKLYGLVVVKGNYLKERNLIYRKVFSETWIEKQDKRLFSPLDVIITLVGVLWSITTTLTIVKDEADKVEKKLGGGTVGRGANTVILIGSVIFNFFSSILIIRSMTEEEENQDAVDRLEIFYQKINRFWEKMYKD